jgi:hypothetical protein
VNARLLALSAAACTGLVLLAAWALNIELGRAMVAAPILVLAFGALAGVVVVLGRAALESFRAVRRPRLVFGLAAVAIVFLLILGLLGVQLPRE